FIINFIFRQLIPRLLTQVNPDKKLLFLLPVFSFFFPPLRFFAYPITLALQKVESAETTPEEEKSRDVVNKEIQTLIAIGKEEDVLEKEEGDMVKSVLEFGDAKAREVMTPRSKIIALQKNATLKEIQNLMVKKKHSRIPIYHENLDRIEGVIYVRHLLKKFEEGKGDDPINNLLLPPVFVSEEKSLSELLKEMQRRRSSMVFVKNEYGGVAGLITIEDLLEEIVGEISDEDQTEEEEIIPHGRNRFLVSGNANLDKLSEFIEVGLADEDCQTIGGLVTKRIGRLPEKGECLEISGISITILNADSRKVNRLLVERSAPLSGDAPSPEQKDT
ncbi:MAG: HlyC/CorC family transporter, partial [Proteobacteria bacterium]|nr:HlyC/CorC family transporter [Pseudomonadota bacterium]